MIHVVVAADGVAALDNALDAPGHDREGGH